MRPILIVPGFGNSGPGHWQSLWEPMYPNMRRVQMPNWNAPRLPEWVDALDTAIERANQEEPPVIVAHSLGCIALVHWASQVFHGVHAALLVAPTDPERPDATEGLRGFAPVPMLELAFPSHVVASSDDPHATIERAKAFAEAWGSAFTDVGPHGHLNAASGHGEWPRGLALLEELLY
jgi:predicted alpha/beta hydrolase family esterase